MRKLPLSLIPIFLTSATLAHEGHDMGGIHWHATDVLGFIVFGALAAMVYWHLRK